VTAAASAVGGLVVGGWGADPADAAGLAASGWPVLADPLSGLRTPAVGRPIGTYEALLRTPGWADRHRPDVVVRLGAPLTSKVTGQWLDGVGGPTVLVDPHHAWADPARAASERVAALPALATPEGGWAERWTAADERARSAIDGVVDRFDEPFEGRVARDVAAVLADGATLVAASSMPVRDLEWFARPRDGVRFLANRGVNGIDGFASTVLGVAAARSGPGPVVGLLGDLAFVHDANGLAGAAARGIDAVLVVLDNGGGGIFSFLAQATLEPERFERFWGTPSGVDLELLAGAHGVPVRTVTRGDEVAPAVAEAVAASGVRVVRVPTDRAANVERHRLVWAGVADAVRPDG
jgi:2-succinyl-5-enolpyruvyl-6-hydroxy-3-cyclohexene-1-carboxylate synthase